MKLALISLILAAAPAIAADAPKAEAPKAAAPKAAAPKAAAKTAPAAPKDPFKTDEERSSYTIGYLQGANFTQFKLTPAEMKAVLSGLSEGAAGTPPKIDVRFYRSRVNDFLTNRMISLAAPEKEKGRLYTEKFVKEFKPKEIPGGGWYLETQAGTGPMPVKTDRVKVNYRGTLIDGKEFDSSFKRGVPYVAPLFDDGPRTVVKCWQNGFQLMKVGGKGKFVCPSEVAYDLRAQGDDIKPGATLTFEVELLEIVKP